MNYKYYPTFKTEGSYWEYIKSWIIFIFFFYLGFKLAKEAFFYIATGKKMFTPIQNYNTENEL